MLIRADANSMIGSGHVMRCISIGKAFLERGCEVAFLTADHDGDDLIRQSGIDVFCLEKDWSNLDSETDALVNLIRKIEPSLLIVDTYYATEYYFDQLSGFVPTAYIDDQNICVWNVDYLINYNIFSSVYDYSAYDDTKTMLILGCRFAPLRDEFRNIPEQNLRENVTNVLISAGGADPGGVTEKIIKEICPLFRDLSFHFIIGALNPRIDSIKLLACDNVVLHINEQNISQLMRRCDAAIAASGSTLYELCACGIPTIAYSLADNQIIAVEEFARQDIMLSAGDSRMNEKFSDDIIEALKLLIEDRDLRNRLSERMREVVDGNGAYRVADILLDSLRDKGVDNRAHAV